MPASIITFLLPALLMQTGTGSSRSSWFNQDPARLPVGHAGPGSIPAPPAPPMALVPMLKRPDPLAEDPEDAILPDVEAARGRRDPVRPEHKLP